MKTERKTWIEEHEEFRARAKHTHPGSKWTLGFYQVLPDETPPTTKLKDNDFTEFLIPETHLSLKLFFDNLRNYGTCGVFAVFGVWVWFNPQGLFLKHIPGWLSMAFALATGILVGCLLLLNCLQTWKLTRELYFSLRAIRIAKQYIFRGETTVQFVLSTCFIVGGCVADLLITLIFLLASAATVFIAAGLVGYTVMAYRSI